MYVRSRTVVLVMRRVAKGSSTERADRASNVVGSDSGGIDLPPLYGKFCTPPADVVVNPTDGRAVTNPGVQTDTQRTHFSWCWRQS